MDARRRFLPMAFALVCATHLPSGALADEPPPAPPVGPWAAAPASPPLPPAPNDARAEPRGDRDDDARQADRDDADARTRERRRRRPPRPPRVAPPPPAPPVHRHYHLDKRFELVVPKAHRRLHAVPRSRQHTRILVLPAPRVERRPHANEAAPPAVAAPERPEAWRPEREDDGDARGGLAFAGGASQYFGFVPLAGDMTASGRLQAVLALPTESSRWLSLATLGLSAAIDVGRNRGVDAQIWRAGLVFALGAPWSRDVLGIAVEGGVLGGRYYDGNATAFDHGSGRPVPGPFGESYGLRFYGLGRLTLQVPLKGDVRPFAAGELGATERPDGELSGIVGVTGGLAWNVW